MLNTTARFMPPCAYVTCIEDWEYLWAKASHNTCPHFRSNGCLSVCVQARLPLLKRVVPEQKRFNIPRQRMSQIKTRVLHDVTKYMCTENLQWITQICVKAYPKSSPSLYSGRFKGSTLRWPSAKARPYPDTCPHTLSLGVSCVQPAAENAQDTQTMAIPSVRGWQGPGHVTHEPRWSARQCKTHSAVKASALRITSFAIVCVDMMPAPVGPPTSRLHIQPQEARDNE